MLEKIKCVFSFQLHGPNVADKNTIEELKMVLQNLGGEFIWLSKS